MPKTVHCGRPLLGIWCPGETGVMRVDGSQDGQWTSTNSRSFSGPLALRVPSRVWHHVPLSGTVQHPACPSDEPYPPWDGILAKCIGPSLLSELEIIGVTHAAESRKLLIGPSILGRRASGPRLALLYLLEAKIDLGNLPPVGAS